MPDDQPFMGSWFLRIDRFADVHLVAAQNKNQSCGLACIKMAVFKINKPRPQSAFAVERDIEQRYRKQAGEMVHDFDTHGSNPTVMVKVLNDLGIGNWAIKWPGVNDVGDKIARYVGIDQFGLGPTGANAIRRGYPVILACYWKDGKGGFKGGHAIVVDTVTRVPLLGTHATICDPWDADIHFEKIETGKPFTYKPTKAIGINLWGDVKGDASGDGVVRGIVYCQKSAGFWGS